MKKALCYDDVLIVPKFGKIKSRADVDTSVKFLGEELSIGIISANMDTVTGSELANTLLSKGAQAALHRFQSIEDNVKMYKKAPGSIVSLGLGNEELERAAALLHVGANKFLIDVAHGANMEVVRQTKALKHLVSDSQIVVGNFASKESVKDFLYHLGGSTIDAIKVGIGGGSGCTTRVVTGCGLPTLHSIIDCRELNIPIIADGGIRNSGDFAKALAAGATAVMVGRLFAGTDEALSELVDANTDERVIGYSQDFLFCDLHKKYRGSASKESYEVQDKEASHRTPEGESFLVPYTGPAVNVLQQLEAGLRSSMSYVGAKNISEFRELAEFVEITPATLMENIAHGKK